MNHQSYSPVVKHSAWLWWSHRASEALSHRLNLYRSMPPDLPRTLCIIRSRKNLGALRAPYGRTNPTLYLCPGPSLLQPLGPLQRTVVFHHLNVFCTSGRVLWPDVVVSPLKSSIVSLALRELSAPRRPRAGGYIHYT